MSSFIPASLAAELQLHSKSGSGEVTVTTCIHTNRDWTEEERAALVKLVQQSLKDRLLKNGMLPCR